MMCTMIWASFLIFPFFFMCCDWWKKCTYAIYDIPESIYQSLDNLTRGGSIKNLTLKVVDNCFTAQKASILYNIIERSSLKGFTFINSAQAFDFNQNEYSHFEANMMPIKTLSSMIVDIRWTNYGCW